MFYLLALLFINHLFSICHDKNILSVMLPRLSVKSSFSLNSMAGISLKIHLFK